MRHSLDRLLDLDGEVMEVGGGFWVKFRITRVDRTPQRPVGIGYSLTMHDPRGRRVLGYDNAHAVSTGNNPSRARPETFDYADAETLLSDFWRDVDRILEEEGIS